MHLNVLSERPSRNFDKYKISGFLFILFVYAPGVFMESLWSDDYGSMIDSSGIANHALKDARPTQAAVLYTSFLFAKDPSDVWILRSLALFALLFIFLRVSQGMKGSHNYNFGIISVAIAFCIPSIQMYIHWANTWSFLWASLAGLVAFDFWLAKSKSKKILAVILLALALTIYPPAALFYFSVISVRNVVNECKSSKFFSDAIRGLILLIISGLISIFLAFATMQIVGVSPNDRVGLVRISGIPEKLIWLLSRPIVIGLRPFTIDSPTPLFALVTSIPIVLILLFGIRRQSRRLKELFFSRSSAIVIPLLFTLIPISITADNQVEFRLLSAYCWGVLAIAVFFLLRGVQSFFITLKTSRKLAKVGVLVTSGALVTIAIFTVNMHYVQLFGGPYQQKTTFLNSRISLCVKEQLVETVLILPPKLPFPSYKRLGVFSMSTDLASPWVPKANVELLLKERNIRVPVSYIESRPSTIKVLKTQCVIDLEDFRQLLI
jgi:hypothetical protein